MFGVSFKDAVVQSNEAILSWRKIGITLFAVVKVSTDKLIPQEQLKAAKSLILRSERRILLQGAAFDSNG